MGRGRQGTMPSEAHTELHMHGHEGLRVTHFAVMNASSTEIPVSEAPTITMRELICTYKMTIHEYHVYERILMYVRTYIHIQI